MNARTIQPDQSQGSSGRALCSAAADHTALPHLDTPNVDGQAMRERRTRIPRLVAVLLALSVQCWSVCACANHPKVSPAMASTPAQVPSPSQVSPRREATPSPRPLPDPSPTAGPAPRWEKDAFLEADFPWADPSSTAFPRRASEARVKVVNSVFFDDPRFFGFDIQTSSGWYHVIGSEHWTVLDGRQVSPGLIHERRPKDGDTVVVYGTIYDQFVIASYVGYPDGTAWYYRSMLSAGELASGRVPPVYDGLPVWVRGVLDGSAGQGSFYVLPEQASFSAQRLGQEALVGGPLMLQGGARVEVTEGIYVKDRGRYVKILASTPPAAQDKYVEGLILAAGRAGRPLQVQCADGSSVKIDFGVTTRLEFADGSPASAADLRPGRRIRAAGTPESGNVLGAARITVVSVIAVGRPCAAFLARGSSDLWTVELEGSAEAATRRQVTHLSAPLAGLENAVFSPDGMRLAFAWVETSGSTLVLGNLQTGLLQELLTDDQWQERDPAWSPEGSRIAFARYRLEGENLVDGGLWVLRWSTGALTRLIPGLAAGWQTVSPRWSPDGGCIAYGHASVDGKQSHLYVLAPPTDNWLVLQYASEWRWSPDSTLLVCTLQSPGETRARLWVVQKDGTSATWLSPNGVNDSRGRLSPDGSCIAFLTRFETTEPPDGLGLMHSDGLDRIQPEERPVASRLAWSPDSRSVVFLRVTASGQAAGLWSVTRDGTGLRQLAADAVALAGTYREP